MKKTCAIFISGNGTNMENIVRKIKSRTLRGLTVAFVFSDNPSARGLARAQSLGVPTCTFSPKEFPSKEKYEQALLTALDNEGVDFIILAGYMRLVGRTLLSRYKNRVMNIHPALLPAFPGMHAIRDAYVYGVKVTGVTVHLVDDGVDTGPIIMQKSLDIKSNESLASLERRIHKVEYALYPSAIQLMISGRLSVSGRRVRVVKR